MAFDKSKSGPENPSNKPEVKLGAPPVQPESPLTQEDVDFNTKVDAKTEQYEKKVEALRKRFQSNGSIGAGKAEVLQANEINRLRVKAGEKKKEFRNLAADMKAQRHSIMLNETEQELEKLYFPYEKIIDYARKLGRIDDAELDKLEALMKAMVELKTNPQLEKLFYKALNKENFSKDDYEKLAGMCQPFDLQKEVGAGQPEKIFEASQVGAVISLMSPSQRYTLSETVLQTLPPPASAQFLETLTTAKVLSTSQLKALCDSGKVVEPFKTQLLSQITDGKMTKKQDEYDKKLQALETLNQGRTADPALSKTIGAPMAYGLASMWGALVMLVNFKAEFRTDHPLESAAKAITTPQFAVGALAAGVGTAGMLGIIAPKKYNNLKDTALDFMAGSDELKQKSAANEQQIHEYVETPFKTNPFLSQFFTTIEEFPDGRKKTGFQVIREMTDKMLAANQPVKLDYQEILKNAGPKQQEALTKALRIEGGQEPILNDKLRTVMAGCTYLNITTTQDFDKLMAQINKKQGIATA